MADIIFDTLTVEKALDRLSESMLAETQAAESICLIGIQRGGAAVADALQQRLQKKGMNVLRGNLDISFYRDDLDTIGPNPEVRPSQLPFDMTGKTLWLVDDVLYTGRTIRAAMGEIFDYGRPAAIRLLVLLDRGGRQLPIAADATGLTHAADPGCSVKLMCDEKGWWIEQRRVK